jgi:hypothetical protein
MLRLYLYARVRFFAQFCTRDRGCSKHPAFPAPSSFKGEEFSTARAHRAARARTHICAPSLRANGSRECAPDDRLREAIHLAQQRKNGLLRCARNDVESQCHPLPSSPADRTEKPPRTGYRRMRGMAAAFLRPVGSQLPATWPYTGPPPTQVCDPPSGSGRRHGLVFYPTG